MAQHSERPRSQGNSLEDALESAPDENRAQAQRDAPPDATAAIGQQSGNSDRADGKGSDANGIPAFDEAAGEERKKLYRDGATLVSRID